MNIQLQTRGTLLDDANFASTIHHLTQYHTEDGVLSVYLNIDDADSAPAAREKALSKLIEPLHMHTNDAWLQGRIEYEIAGLTDAVHAWSKPPGRAVAMFFCGPGGLDVMIPLRFHVPSFARFARRPVLGPLIAALDEQRRYCVVIFERRRARIISVMLGEVEDEVTIESDVTGHAGMRGWGSEPPVAHVRSGDLHAHAIRTVEHVWAIDCSRPIHGLMLAGDGEALTALKQVLPRSLARSVIDAPTLDYDVVAPDVAYRVRAVDQARRESEDLALVDRLCEERTDDLAVKGWGPTLEALNDGRVHVLILPGEGALKGFYCPQDHFVTLQAATPACPACGAELQGTEHIGEAAIRSALMRDGQVHVLASRAAAKLGRFGTAALLRY